MWAEGNDPPAFQNIPVVGFGARAPALIGESLERCFRAQWRCYHVVSGLNGLQTVCLKNSHNDRDQLITASTTHCTESHQTLSWMNKRRCTFVKIWVVRMGVLHHTLMVSEPSITQNLEVICEMLRFSGSISFLCIKKEEKPTISTCANTVNLPHPSPLLSLPTSV